jgi:acetyl-CoA carboxylase biotin carboxyl carrier protein
MKFLESELSYKFTYKDIVDIIKIIDDASCHELQIELEDLKIKIVKGTTHGSSPAVTSVIVPPAHAVSEAQSSAGFEKQLTKSKHKPGVKPVDSGEASNKIKAPAGEEKIEGVPILSPLAGVFYCAPEPGAKPFVEVGSRVEKGQQVGIVEVMKLMNSIKAPVSGVVREIRVKNEETVGMGQILMTIKPS